MENNVEITLGEVLDAMEKNGYPQAKYVYDDSQGAYCAVGQAAKNLGVTPINLAHGLNLIRVPREGFTSYLSNEIFSANDEKGWTCQEIAQYYRKLLADKLDVVVWTGSYSEVSNVNNR